MNTVGPAEERTHVPEEGDVASGVLGKSGRTLGKGMLMVLPLWGLEKPLEDGDTEPKERSPSEARFFSGRGGCPGRGRPCPCRTGLWWPPCPGATVRKLWGRKPLSAAAAAVRGAPGGWDTPWGWASRAPGSSLGGRPRASAASTRDSSRLWKEAGSSAAGRCGRPGPGPSLPGPGNSLALRRLPGGGLRPSRARVALGLVSTHWCSAERGLFRGQINRQRGSRWMERPKN